MSPVAPAPLSVRLRRSFRRGDQFIWLSGAALGLALLMISGLLFIVVANGFAFFWPAPVATAEMRDGPPLLGVVSDHQAEVRNVEGAVIRAAQTQLKIGNRELYGFDFKWMPDTDIKSLTYDPAVIALERQENGDFFGFLVDVRHNGAAVATGANAWPALHQLRGPARDVAAQAKSLQREKIGEVNAQLQAARFELRQLNDGATPPTERDPRVAAIAQRVTLLDTQYESLRARATDLLARSRQDVATFRTIDGQEKSIPLADIVRAYQPNAMSTGAKLWHYAGRGFEFITGEPRESNTEGGVLPAIFGTVAMTIIMSLVVTPFGVITALYLREYAKQGPVVRVVRIAINNLAGVPSIVFGVFGLGFFVYFIGGGIDRLFFPDALPTPTFGTGGILWASLTLALLAVPVVIVATEESIAAVPRGMREGSLALGASKFQTICKVVLPASVPGILTGVILSMARGAGEVAPLMITGVVKLAPELPFDSSFPFVHLDRKFMHLGFHIFDVGFQSPNIEAAKPMVFTTTLLLITIVILLNFAAIRLRDRIRRRFKTGAFA